MQLLGNDVSPRQPAARRSLRFQLHGHGLGVDRRCTLAQIRAVYPLLAKQHHPDRHPDSKQVLARTQKLNAAHKTLSDQGAPA